jgi:hypothetical protein
MKVRIKTFNGELPEYLTEGATHYEIYKGCVEYLLNDEGHWMGADGEGNWWNLFSGDFPYYEQNAKPL